jgi:hypothetical protein
MLPIHGRAVNSEEIEIGIGREFGDPRRFPSLCNSLIWAYAKSASASLPSFTERVNVADQGIDAEWETELPADYDSPLLGPGWNVFQYKQHDVSARGRGRASRGSKTSSGEPLRTFIRERVDGPRGTCCSRTWTWATLQVGRRDN